MRGPSVRLIDVARAAGVSLGTASNAFNRPELVREEVRSKIADAAQALGYTGPDPKGRLLMGAKADAIGVLPPGDFTLGYTVASPFFHDFLQGIAETCDDHHANLLILPGTPARKQAALRNALVDGFILGQPDEIALLSVRERKVPFVVIDLVAGRDVNSVRIDGRDGARQAARHLLDLGHRRFALACSLRRALDAVWHPPPRDAQKLVATFPLDHEKLEGYADALAESGVPIGEVPLAQFHLEEPRLSEGARLLFDHAPDATAILAMSDRQARAIVAEARRRGRQVPGDVSVVGFDDTADALLTDPPLTTVSQSLIEKGRLAARLLFEGGPPRQALLPARLVVRGSTAPPAA